ncbi:accessory factor associated with RNA polymerase II [Scheffersomyces stipitis CBS 6054]|uniref:Accessory factor associated with RNA polymerase II n=1 Tax=Scheffersomyces stipitis (strain ATCC 58785 / CBS 6054 / NBRC 10063 / NRRL Y-11545) TaxID=322104 RepID=A3LX30_PICST|nr:accessory factor associated with RNA polymerase II [Scheffersomyces stipitis CBS 6054]ABN67393.2 accessory factor associated with RNA polymerase II [Scheffersomyces stipitis CBS 6054]
MSSVVSASILHRATTHKEPIKFFKIEGSDSQSTESIKDATHVQFGNNEENIYDLNSITNFYNEDKPQNLRAVIFCWLHDKSSIVDYKNECSELGIADFKFLVKTELTTWLNGNSDSCTFVKDEKVGEVAVDSSSKSKLITPSTATDATTTDKKHKLEDPQIERISQFERDSIDHNAALRGSKNVEFGQLVSDAKRLIQQLKRSKPNGAAASRDSGPKKKPLIIVSPASTALLSLSNVKQFLEEGKFTEPNPTNRPSGGLVTINHPSERLIPVAHQIMVVDNVDMFTKPEYWDNVVAIFTTGQSWQFAKYKYSQPETLFQRYAGFFLSYSGDPTPPQIKDWNVSEIKVDRGDKRFRDKMIVKDFWAEIEKILLAKGYGKQ